MKSVRKGSNLSQPGQTYPVRCENAQLISKLKEMRLGVATIYKLLSFCDSIGKNRITAAELAEGFGITVRSARRILAALEDQRWAEVIGEEQLSGRGRPRYVYQINVVQMQVSRSSIYRSST